MPHTVAVGEFEGPLGILLELVERGKLEVTAISVATITAQYLDRINEIETRTPDGLSEFVQLGARLVYIKSLALLPPSDDQSATQTEELRQLNFELEEYRRMQAAARSLAARSSLRTWERRITERLSPHELPLPTLELPQLAAAFTAALRRTEPTPETKLIRSHLSQETVQARLRKRLTSGFDLQEVLDSCRDRIEVIVTFLALLELIHEGVAVVTQADQFEAIRVEAAHVHA